MERAAPPIDDITIFVAVAQDASFTRAAEQLGKSKSNVGKAVQRLEARLGTRLFQRTTRAVRLTEDGETYLEAARAALAGLNDAEISLAARREEPAGRVRLDMPVGFGRLFLPTFRALRKRYPLVTLELSLSDRHSDAVKEGWDIVVRIGELPSDGGITVRKLCDLRKGLYAAPAYLAEHGRPASIRDFAAHETIGFRGSSGRPWPWVLRDPQGTLVEAFPPPALLLADGRALVDAAIQGLGIAQVFDRVALPHVEAGQLEHVLPDADTDGPPVHALIPLGRRMPPKTRVVLDHLAEVLRAPL